MSPSGMRLVGLKIPLADLFGIVTFYHHFSCTSPGQRAPRVCMGPVCCLRGGKDIIEDLREEGAISMPCAGRCDDFVPVLEGHKVLVGARSDTLAVPTFAFTSRKSGWNRRVRLRLDSNPWQI